MREEIAVFILIYLLSPFLTFLNTRTEDSFSAIWIPIIWEEENVRTREGIMRRKEWPINRRFIIFPVGYVDLLRKLSKEEMYGISSCALQGNSQYGVEIILDLDLVMDMEIAKLQIDMEIGDLLFRSEIDSIKVKSKVFLPFKIEFFSCSFWLLANWYLMVYHKLLIFLYIYARKFLPQVCFSALEGERIN